MVVDEEQLARGCRRSWYLVFFAAALVVLFLVYVFALNQPGKAPGWDMGGKPFVPASSKYAVEYWTPPDPGYEPKPPEAP